MKKLTLAVGFILICQILPLLGNADLIFHLKNIVILVANGAIWFTQPPVSGAETIANRNKDKYSVLLIIFISMVSIMVSVIDWGYFNNRYDHFWVSVLGIILLFFGIAIRVWAIQTLGKHFTATVQIKENHQLITNGPYSIVRHPSYLGAWMAITGTALFLNSYIGVLVAFFGMMYAYYVRIAVEEKALTDSFGLLYKDYQRRVKKIIPLIW